MSLLGSMRMTPWSFRVSTCDGQEGWAQRLRVSPVPNQMSLSLQGSWRMSGLPVLSRRKYSPSRSSSFKVMPPKARQLLATLITRSLLPKARQPLATLTTQTSLVPLPLSSLFFLFSPHSLLLAPLFSSCLNFQSLHFYMVVLTSSLFSFLCLPFLFPTSSSTSHIPVYPSRAGVDDQD